MASGISWSNCSLNIRSGDQATNYFKVDQLELRTSVEDLRVFKLLAERGDLTQLPADALSHISLLPNGTYFVDSPRRSATHKSGFRLRNGDGGNVPASHTTSP